MKLDCCNHHLPLILNTDLIFIYFQKLLYILVQCFLDVEAKVLTHPQKVFSNFLLRYGKAYEWNLTTQPENETAVIFLH